jgi:hypothetical protein
MRAQPPDVGLGRPNELGCGGLVTGPGTQGGTGYRVELDRIHAASFRWPLQMTSSDFTNLSDSTKLCRLHETVPTR